jgi:hypothetical protein
MDGHWTLTGDDDDPETTVARAEITRHQRELRLAGGWHPGGWTGPDASVRYIMSRAAEERRLAAAAGDVRGPDEALARLVTITHEWR